MSKPLKDPDQVELESQFILRLPPEPAKVLRDIVRSGASSIKDRLAIKLENDVRYGEVRLDNWFMPARVMDLPTIIESLKTIDGKNFYKTADICQIMICREENDEATTDEESPSKHKKKDPNKVDKKFLWPHGVTPPLKNVRRRRFRKTLRKKFVEAPEIEKEVKRLLRVDCEAVHVRWEVIDEEDERKEVTIKEEPVDESELPAESTQQSVDVAEDDLFGEPVSDSDDDGANMMEIEESRLSAGDDSQVSNSVSLQGTSDGTLVTQFSREMFHNKEEEYILSTDRPYDEMEEAAHIPVYRKIPHQLSQQEIKARLEQLQRELVELRVSQENQEMEIAHIENPTLRQRLQDALQVTIMNKMEKEREYQELSDMLL